MVKINYSLLIVLKKPIFIKIKLNFKFYSEAFLEMYTTEL